MAGRPQKTVSIRRSDSIADGEWDRVVPPRSRAPCSIFDLLTTVKLHSPKAFVRVAGDRRVRLSIARTPSPSSLLVARDGAFPVAKAAGFTGPIATRNSLRKLPLLLLRFARLPDAT